LTIAFPETHRCRRQHRRRWQPAPHDARPKHAAPFLATPAEEQKRVNASHAHGPLMPAEAPSATRTPAETRPARCPPRAREAGLADAGGGTETSKRLSCPPAPKNCTIPAGHTDAGGNAPLVLLTPAAEQKRVNASLAHAFLIHAQPPPARQTPAATRPARCPLQARAGGLADAGGRTVTHERLSCMLPPPTHPGAAGHRDAGGHPPRTMPASGTRHRSCRRRRRNRNT